VRGGFRSPSRHAGVVHARRFRLEESGGVVTRGYYHMRLPRCRRHGGKTGLVAFFFFFLFIFFFFFFFFAFLFFCFSFFVGWQKARKKTRTRTQRVTPLSLLSLKGCIENITFGWLVGATMAGVCAVARCVTVRNAQHVPWGSFRSRDRPFRRNGRTTERK